MQLEKKILKAWGRTKSDISQNERGGRGEKLIIVRECKRGEK